MNLNPEDRKNWQGFLDLLQPPPGYRLGAALGTTFGLSMDALVAALLAMCDADGEELAANPVAATMAITRMGPKVRVLLHPATISGPTTNEGSGRFIALLDRLVVEVQPTRGLFHPKVWAMRFDRIGPGKDAEHAQIGRVLIGSRNLTRSSSFELGAAFEGTVAAEGANGSELGADVARAFRQWLGSTGVRYPEAVWRLPQFVSRLVFDVPNEAREALRMRWQGEAQKPLADALPDRLHRAVVVAPFIQPDFLTMLLERAERVHVVSIPETLDALPDETIIGIGARAEAQGMPVLYQVTGHGNPDDSYIDGIHAKLLLTEDRRQRSATFVGSANATAPGWGLAEPVNVEAVVEMRPGVGIDSFVTQFIRSNKTTIHPWISEYDRSARSEPDLEREAERHVLAALREVAKIDLHLRYDTDREALTLSVDSRRSALPPWVTARGVEFSAAPLLLCGTPGAWRSIPELQSSVCQYDHVPVAKVSRFVALRAQSQTPLLERQRLVVARLEAPKSLLDERDEAIRKEILATADPAMVLNALVRGLAHVRSGRESGSVHAANRLEIRSLLAETTLERLLQAVALDRQLIDEIRLLLGPLHGEPLRKLCDDLKEVVDRVFKEARS